MASTFGCQANYIYDFYVTNELTMLSLMGQFGFGSVFRFVFSRFGARVSATDERVTRDEMIRELSIAYIDDEVEENIS